MDVRFEVRRRIRFHQTSRIGITFLLERISVARILGIDLPKKYKFAGIEIRILNPKKKFCIDLLTLKHLDPVQSIDKGTIAE